MSGERAAMDAVQHVPTENNVMVKQCCDPLRSSKLDWLWTKTVGSPTWDRPLEVADLHRETMVPPRS